jgi:hypothetical protein
MIQRKIWQETSFRFFHFKKNKHDQILFSGDGRERVSIEIGSGPQFSNEKQNST